MTLRLYPLPSLYDDDIASVRAATPADVSGFYLKRPYNVPWSALPTTFIFETDRPTEPHAFVINETESFTFIPGSSPISLQIQLKQGSNSIDIETPAFANKGLWSASAFYQRYDSVGYDGTSWICLQPNVGVTPVEGPFWSLSSVLAGEREVAYYTVAATGVQTWLAALGREVYLSAGKRLREVQAQALSPWTTRISSHFLDFTNLFLPARMPKIHQTRIALCVSMGRRLGFGDGVINMGAAVSYSTPYVTRARNSEFDVPGLDPDYAYVTTTPTTAEDRGRLLDIWSPNQCLAAKQALVQLALNLGSNDTPQPKPMELVSVDDYQVLLATNISPKDQSSATALTYNSSIPYLSTDLYYNTASAVTVSNSGFSGVLEAHLMNPSSPECANIEFDTNCLGDLRVFADFDGVLDIFMNTPQLPFDMAVETPLLFGFWDEGSTLDMSAGSGSSGLGAGDEHFDTVDVDDPFGTGFFGVSLSRRLEAPMCLDTRLQLGRRMVQHTTPLLGTGGLTPGPDVDQAGTQIIVDLSSPGAPIGAAGTTTLWAISPLNFIYQGDMVRFEAPDEEIQIVSAWPAFDPAKIVKNIPNVTVGVVGVQYLASAPSPEFSFLHEGWGVRITNGVTTSFASIVSVDSTGTVLTLAGNVGIPTGVCSVDLYAPLRDPASGSPLTGRRVYEIKLATPLSVSMADRQVLDHRHSPRVMDNFPLGAEVIRVASDSRIVPGDRLYFDSNTSAMVTMTNQTSVHPTTKWPVYEVLLDSPTPVVLNPDQDILSISSDACWRGDPVTTLKLITLVPENFIIP